MQFRIKVKTADDTKDLGDLATFYINTISQKFIDELKKYVCPMRIVLFIEEQENLSECILIKQTPPDNSIDLKIDLSQKYKEIEKSCIAKGDPLGLTIDKYIENTPHLDKYGN